MSAADAAAARSRAMLEEPPLRLLLRMASPNALAFLVQASVSMVEAWYIGRLGTASLAAIALILPGLMLMQMLSGGAFGGAVTSAVARAVGAGQPERAQRLMWHALAIGMFAGVTFALLWLLAGEALLLRLGARGEVLQAALAYGNLLFAGCTLIWLSSLLSAVLRGVGEIGFPARLMLVSAALQIPLSGALVLGVGPVPSLGIVGAAVSVLTVAAVTVCLQLRRLVGRAEALRLDPQYLRLESAHFIDILRVGALAALSPVFTVLTIGMINGLVARQGEAAIAGYGIGARMEFLLVPLVFGIGSAMTSLVGVNVGAGRIDRAERIGWTGAACAATLTGVVGLLLALVPGLWMDIFTDDVAARAAGADYLRIAGPAFAFQGLGLALYFASQGARAVFWPVVGTIARFAVSVGGAYALVRWSSDDVAGVFACIALGMVVYGVITAASLALGAWRRANP